MMGDLPTPGMRKIDPAGNPGRNPAACGEEQVASTPPGIFRIADAGAPRKPAFPEITRPIAKKPDDDVRVGSYKSGEFACAGAHRRCIWRML